MYSLYHSHSRIQIYSYSVFWFLFYGLREPEIACLIKILQPKLYRSFVIHRPISNLTIENKLLIYKAIIIHTRILTYGLELWGCASKSNISIIQRSKSKILGMIVDAPSYVSNATLHADLGIIIRT
jgi:hypothetical protein